MSMYHPGELVMINPDLEKGSYYNTEPDTGDSLGYRCYVTEEMMELRGEVFTIEALVNEDSYGSHRYLLAEDAMHWNWTDQMLLPAAVVSDDGLYESSDGGSLSDLIMSISRE